MILYVKNAANAPVRSCKYSILHTINAGSAINALMDASSSSGLSAVNDLTYVCTLVLGVLSDIKKPPRFDLRGGKKEYKQ